MSILTTWRLASSRVSDSRKRKDDGNIFYNLGLDPTHYHFLSRVVCWSLRLTMSQCGRGQYKSLNAKDPDCWGHQFSCDLLPSPACRFVYIYLLDASVETLAAFVCVFVVYIFLSHKIINNVKAEAMWLHVCFSWAFENL